MSEMSAEAREQEWQNVNQVMELVKHEGDAACERAFDFLIRALAEKDEARAEGLGQAREEMGEIERQIIKANGPIADALAADAVERMEIQIAILNKWLEAAREVVEVLQELHEVGEELLLDDDYCQTSTEEVARWTKALTSALAILDSPEVQQWAGRR